MNVAWSRITQYAFAFVTGDRGIVDFLHLDPEAPHRRHFLIEIGLGGLWIGKQEAVEPAEIAGHLRPVADLLDALDAGGLTLDEQPRDVFAAHADELGRTFVEELVRCAVVRDVMSRPILPRSITATVSPRSVSS